MGTDIFIYLGGLALLDTLSPTIIGVTLFLVLTDKRNLTSRLLAYLLTVGLLYFSLGIIMMLGLNLIIETFSNIFQNKIFSWLIFIVGVILFIASFFIPANKKSNIPKPKTQSIFSIIIIGVTTFIVEAGMALPYFTAIGLLTTSDIPFYQWLPIIAVYNFIMILPALLIFLGFKLFGKWINPILVNLRNKISSSSSSALSWMMCIVGVILIFYTIDYL
ncbi:GAP family protein [Lysinibacillus xylanilyticus]|uniref:GAP family protein n=1 Tax=Lysinibacillus xylanilyticus TaxID=582475 RepID=UPI002B247519|nr:GAP family protein [Lysinibacillus xylanilyticus]MEB2299037.1 GAP family protein [Lysinibacillus xylanilyticus]